MERFRSDTGYLELLIGPMYAGKTSRLINIHKQMKVCDIPSILVNHAHDIRYGSSSEVTNHDSLHAAGIATASLHNTFPISEQMEYDAYLINEAQFFVDVVSWVKCVVSPPYNKHVVLGGLDGDYKREPFGRWLELIPHADRVEKLGAICAHCKKARAIFTQRLSGYGDDQIVIDDAAYRPVCRACYQLPILSD